MSHTFELKIESDTWLEMVNEGSADTVEGKGVGDEVEEWADRTHAVGGIKSVMISKKELAELELAEEVEDAFTLLVVLGLTIWSSKSREARKGLPTSPKAGRIWFDTARRSARVSIAKQTHTFGKAQEKKMAIKLLKQFHPKTTGVKKAKVQPAAPVVEREVVVIELLKPVASEVVAEVAKIEPELLEKEVKLQLPFKGETAAYLEVEIEGIGKWLSKASLDRWSISQGTVRVVMTRAQAARRKLVAA